MSRKKRMGMYASLVVFAGLLASFLVLSVEGRNGARSEAVGQEKAGRAPEEGAIVASADEEPPWMERIDEMAYRHYAMAEQLLAQQIEELFLRHRTRSNVIIVEFEAGLPRERVKDIVKSLKGDMLAMLPAAPQFGPSPRSSVYIRLPESLGVRKALLRLLDEADVILDARPFFVG